MYYVTLGKKETQQKFRIEKKGKRILLLVFVEKRKKKSFNSFSPHFPSLSLGVMEISHMSSPLFFPITSQTHEAKPRLTHMYCTSFTLAPNHQNHPGCQNMRRDFSFSQSFFFLPLLPVFLPPPLPPLSQVQPPKHQTLPPSDI